MNYSEKKESVEEYLASQKKSRRRIITVNVIAGLIGITIFTAAVVMSWQLQEEIKQKREILNELNKLIENNRIERLKKKKLVVGRKNFLEQDILCELVASVIENDNPDLEVIRGRQRETRNNYNQLRLGEIDLYIEYTGTAVVELLKLPVKKAKSANPETLNRLFTDRNLKWLPKLGFNNSYAIVMLKETADSLGIRKISDLSRISHDLTFALEDEFYLRESDGYQAFKQKYGLRVDDEKLQLVRKDFKYKPLINNQADVGIGYTTDPELVLGGQFDTLEDDKNFFPPYYAAPLVHQEVLKKFPNIEGSLNSLAGQISKQDMATLIKQAKNSDFLKSRNQEVLKNMVVDFLNKKWPQKFSGKSP